MKTFSQAISRIGTENAFAVGPEINSWIEKGFNITKLTVGEPGGNIIRSATQAAITSFKNHETHYTPAAGSASLRTKIAAYMTTTRKVKFTADDIVLTPGGKPVIAGTIFILVNPGDEVIYPTPCYPIYESMVDFVGAKSKPVELKEKRGFRFDIKELADTVSKKTKLLILNSPSNPTGGVLNEKDMAEIARLAKKYDFFVFSDEIYSRMVYGSGFRRVTYQGRKFPVAPSIISQPGMGTRTIILDGFSKTYAMTGLRVGFACTKNRAFMEKFVTYAINFWSCLPQPCMRAAEAALDSNQTETQKEMEQYKQKRDLIVKLINDIEGVHCSSPDGAFYLFVNVTQACKRLRLANAEAFRKYLLTFDRKNKRGVAVLTRGHFGKKLKSEKEQYIRISFAGSMADLKEGAKRIRQAVEKK